MRTILKRPAPVTDTFFPSQGCPLRLYSENDSGSGNERQLTVQALYNLQINAFIRLLQGCLARKLRLHLAYFIGRGNPAEIFFHFILAVKPFVFVRYSVMNLIIHDAQNGFETLLKGKILSKSKPHS